MASSLICCILPNGTPPMFRSIEMFATAWLVEPTYKVVHDALLRGDGLLWNPYLAMGSPLWANIVMQVVNPLAWIAGFPEPSPETVLRYIVTYMLCAGFFSFLFLRQFLPAFSSAFGALAYMLNGYFMLYIGMSELSSCALIPGLFYATEKLLREPGVKSAALLSLLTAAMVTICGIPELSLLAVCGSGLYFLFRLFTKANDSESSLSSKESRVKIVSCYIAANLLAGLYAAPLLLPFVEFLRESFNSHVRSGDFIPAGQEVFPFASANLITYLSPYFLSPILRYSTVESPYQGYTGYWGITVFSLAALATVQAVTTLLHKTAVVPDQKFRTKQLLSIFCALSVFLLLAKKFGCPALQWFGALPLFSMILYWKYTEPIVAFLVAVLAAIGLSWLSDNTLKLKTIRVVGLSVFVVYIVLALTSIPLQRQEAQFYCYLVWGLATLVMGLFFSLASLAISQRRNVKQTCLFIFAMAAVELLLNFSGPSIFRDSTPKRDNNPYAGAPFITFLQQLKGNQKYERLFAQDLILIGNWASAFGLYDSRAYNALYPRRLMPFYRAFAYGDKPVSMAPGCWMPVGNFIPADLTEELYGYEPVVDPFVNKERALQILRLWQLTSARYIVRNVNHRSALPSEVSTKAGCEDPLIYSKEVNIFALSKVLPRASLYYQVETLPDENAVLAKLTNPEFAPFRKAVLEQSEITDKELSCLSKFSPVEQDLEAQQITKYKGENVDIEVKAKHHGLLLLNDIFYPGWQAFIDGKETKIIHANYLFRGVFVPAGDHLVTFRYKPMSLLIGIGLAVLGVIFLAGWWSISTVAERKRKREKFD